MENYNFVSLLGMFLLLGFAYLCSTNRREVNWHVLVWGVGLQLLIGWFLFVFPSGVKFFLWMNDMIVKVLNSASAGSQFLFGVLSLPPGTFNLAGEKSVGFILAFQALPTIIFFSALMSILYFFNILPRIIQGFAFLFTKLMKVSGAESLCAASNIFVGVESTLIIRPFLKNMTRSELCTVLTAGMATVSSNVMAIYVFSLKDVFPSIAGHLMTASFLSAPAALVMSKLLLPETGNPQTLGEHIEMQMEKESSMFEAVINGANNGLKLILGISALLIAVLGLVALFDQILGWVGGLINALLHIHFTWSLKNILGIMFYPFIAILGMPLSDVKILAPIIGERVVLTEVASYQDLASVIQQGLLTNPRSAVIASYALCGFAHLASMAIFIGGVSALVPEKIKDLSQVGFRSLVAATLACLMTACVAGLFYTQESLLLGL